MNRTEECFDGAGFAPDLETKRVFHEQEPPLLLITTQSIPQAVDLIESVLGIVNKCLTLDAGLSTVHILNKLSLELAIVGMREKLIVHENNFSLQLLVSSFESSKLILEDIHVIPVNFLKVERKDLNLKVNLLGTLVLPTLNWSLCCATTRRDSDGVLFFSDPLLQLVQIGRVEIACPVHILLQCGSVLRIECNIGSWTLILVNDIQLNLE